MVCVIGPKDLLEAFFYGFPRCQERPAIVSGRFRIPHPTLSGPGEMLFYLNLDGLGVQFPNRASHNRKRVFFGRPRRYKFRA